jgi:hypothetical protein
MYYTHHFAHHSTLRRACQWLDHLGLHPEYASGPEEGNHRLCLAVDRGQLAEVELLINALENADPEGWPSFWDEARLAYSAPAPRVKLDAAPSSNRPIPIGWHPIDAIPFAGADLERLREAMGH